MTPTPPNDQSMLARLQRIEWLVLDVDGVLTDGRIVYDSAGVEQKSFHVRDGSGLKIWQHLGKQAAIITGRSSRIVEIRAAELGISPVYQGAREKLPALRRFIAETGCDLQRVCAIGDDVPDLGVLRNCGFSVAVADACPEVRNLAHRTTRTPGGAGAVREVIEWILQAQGLWDDVVRRFIDEPLSL